MAARPQDYKLYSILNSTDHEIFHGILTFMSRKNSILGLSEPKEANFSVEHETNFYNLGARLFTAKSM